MFNSSCLNDKSLALLCSARFSLIDDDNIFITKVKVYTSEEESIYLGIIFKIKNTLFGSANFSITLFNSKISTMF